MSSYIIFPFHHYSAVDTQGSLAMSASIPITHPQNFKHQPLWLPNNQKNPQPFRLLEKLHIPATRHLFAAFLLTVSLFICLRSHCKVGAARLWLCSMDQGPGQPGLVTLDRTDLVSSTELSAMYYVLTLHVLGLFHNMIHPSPTLLIPSDMAFSLIRQHHLMSPQHHSNNGGPGSVIILSPSVTLSVHMTADLDIGGGGVTLQ